MADNNAVDGGNTAPGGTPAPNPQFINLKVVGQDSKELHFRVKMSTRLIKMKKSYADRIGVDVATIRFLFDGTRVQDDDTPGSLKLENNDVFDAFQNQYGGYSGTPTPLYSSPSNQNKKLSHTLLYRRSSSTTIT